MIITGAVTLFQVLLAGRKSRALSTIQLCWGLIPTTAQGRRSCKFEVFVRVLHPYIALRTASCDGLKIRTILLDRQWNFRTSSGVHFGEVTHSLKPSDLLSQYSEGNIHAHTEVTTCYPGIQKACFVGPNTLTTNSFTHQLYTPIPVDTRSKAWVCDRLLAGLRVPIAPWAWMSPASVVRCQTKVSVSGWSLVQRSSIKCGVPNVCDRRAP